VIETLLFVLAVTSCNNVLQASQRARQHPGVGA